MAATAIDDAKRFLDLHPWSTTDIDNPVELLREVVKEFDANLETKTEEIEKELDAETKEEAEELAGDVVQKLCAFIKGLRDDLKISEAEYQTALALARVQ